MASPTAANGEAQAEGTITQGLINMHRYKMTPPTFTGEYGTFEEWKYKFQAYMGLMDNALPQLLENTENSTTIIKDADLIAAASSTEEANKWIQLSTGLRYILINICSGAAAQYADNTRQAMALRSTDNCVYGSQYQWEQGQ